MARQGQIFGLPLDANMVVFNEGRIVEYTTFEKRLGRKMDKGKD